MADLRERLEAIFGMVKTIDLAAKALQVHAPAIYRWLSGERTMPGPAKSAMNLREAWPTTCPHCGGRVGDAELPEEWRTP